MKWQREVSYFASLEHLLEQQGTVAGKVIFVVVHAVVLQLAPDKARVMPLKQCICFWSQSR
jgi:hypothetical protein